MIRDERQIAYLCFPGDYCISVGDEGVTEIRPYHESGQCAPIVWFEVRVGNSIVQRINAAHVALVGYDNSEETS